jgi:hypothetical protein
MVVNFKTRGISRGMYKLFRTSTLIKKNAMSSRMIKHARNFNIFLIKKTTIKYESYYKKSCILSYVDRA